MTRDNTRDVIREHHEAEAARLTGKPWDGLTGKAEQAAIRQWQKERNGREDLLRACIEKNEPPPHDTVFEALLYVWDYPARLGGIGLHYPTMRQAPVVQRAFAEIEAQFNYAGRVLCHKARTMDAETAVAVDAGLKALRATFAPNPDGYGTATGIQYPCETWPDDMNANAAAWGRLPEPLRANLFRLCDALARLNHSSGDTVTVKKKAPSEKKTATPTAELESEIIRLLSRDFPNTKAHPTAAAFWQEHFINGRSMRGLSDAKGWKIRTMKKRKADIRDHLRRTFGMDFNLDDFKNVRRKSGRITYTDPAIIERTHAD